MAETFFHTSASSQQSCGAASTVLTLTLPGTLSFRVEQSPDVRIPSCFVKALASSARPAPGPGAFGGFESQSAELYPFLPHTSPEQLTAQASSETSRKVAILPARFPAAPLCPALCQLLALELAGRTALLDRICLGCRGTTSNALGYKLLLVPSQEEEDVPQTKLGALSTVPHLHSNLCPCPQRS